MFVKIPSKEIKKILESKILQLKTINNVAKYLDMELVKGKGYFYWIGTRYNVANKLMELKTTSIFVNNLNDLSPEQWMKELTEIYCKTFNVYSCRLFNYNFDDKTNKEIKKIDLTEHNQIFFVDKKKLFEIIQNIFDTTTLNFWIKKHNKYDVTIFVTSYDTFSQR